MPAKRCLISCGVILLFLLSVLKPAVITMGNQTRLLALFRWQSGNIRFVNSVTEKPISIYFRVGRVFTDFSVSTDETTEAYYTNGLYSMNETVSKESTNILRFCTIKGISLTLGFYDFLLKDGCLEVKLLWTI